MPTKETLSDELNEMLGTEFDFSGMKKDELKLLVELVDEGALLEPQAKHVVKEHGKSKLDEQVDSWTPGQYVSKLL